MPEWIEMDIASLDTETTGLDFSDARVIEIGIVCFHKGQQIQEYSQLLDPEEPIPPEVVKTTKITDKDVAGKPKFRDVAGKVMECLNDRIFLAYNAPFDIGMLTVEFKRLGMEMPPLTVIDPLVLAREVLHLKSYRLGVVAEHLGISMERAHRAKDDAIAAAMVLYGIADKLPHDLDKLLQLQQQWQNAQKAKRSGWDRDKNNGKINYVLNPGAEKDSGLRLGPAYAYSRETNPDPLIAFIRDYASRTGG